MIASTAELSFPIVAQVDFVVEFHHQVDKIEAVRVELGERSLRSQTIPRNLQSLAQSIKESRNFDGLSVGQQDPDLTP